MSNSTVATNPVVILLKQVISIHAKLVPEARFRYFTDSKIYASKDFADISETIEGTGCPHSRSCPSATLRQAGW